MLFPAFPRPHDTIGICAPSAGVGHKLDSFGQSLAQLSSCGFSLRETASVRQRGVRSNRAEIRGAEFNELVTDPSVRAILAATGGEYNLEMLPYLDEEALRRTPKWIAGASDPTNILYYVTTKLDIATLYGFNAGSFDWQPLHRFQRDALSILQGDLVKQDSFAMYDSDRTFSRETPQLDAAVYWSLFQPDGKGRFRPGGKLSAEGILLGGCIDCIANLIGTPYDGTEAFLARHGSVLWYFDNFAMAADDLYRTLLQMKFCGYFRTAKAVLFGRTMLTENSDEDYIERLQDVLSVPFVWNADIGHVKPCLTLINGAHGHLTCSDGKGSLTMTLRESKEP